MKFVYCDGGRSKYFKAENVGDCVTRAIANATGIDYKVIYDRLKELSEKESVKYHRGHKQSSVRDGVFKETWKKYLKEIGWVKHSTCGIGSADKMHFTEEEVPNGICIIQLSKHLTCIKDKVIYDTYDCSVKEYTDFETGEDVINDKRCVYAYWTAPTAQQAEEQEHFKKLASQEKEALTQTKAQIKEIKKKYEKQINKFKRKMNKLKRQMKREIANVKKLNGDRFVSQMLDDAVEQ